MQGMEIITIEVDSRPSAARAALPHQGGQEKNDR
jgi:hypothetical protein